MARIRTIKPEFWSDEKLTECSLSARLTFIGLWSFADDEGRMEFQPVRLKMQIFPCGTVALTKLTEYFGELTERSLIRRYVVDGKEFLDIPGFAKHQRINRPTPSRLPEHSLNTHGVLSEHSPLEGKGREGKGTGSDEVAAHTKVLAAGASPPKARRTSRVPEDFLPDLTYARAQVPDIDAEREAQKFRDWEFKTPRSDWAACWRNWIGTCRDSGKYAKTSTNGSDRGLPRLNFG